MCYKCEVYIGFQRFSTYPPKKNVKYLLEILKKIICQNDNILGILCWMQCISKINFTYFFSLFLMWPQVDLKLHMWLTFFIGLNHSQSFAKLTNRLALVPIHEESYSEKYWVILVFFFLSQSQFSPWQTFPLTLSNPIMTAFILLIAYSVNIFKGFLKF